jgi:hypothetical protein
MDTKVGLFLGIPNPDGKKDWAKLIYTLDNIDQTDWRTLIIGAYYLHLFINTYYLFILYIYLPGASSG